MKKKEIVKAKEDFNLIIKNGIKMGNEYFTIFFMNYDKENPLFGVTTQKKSGNAVVRNRLKRQLKALIDETKLLFKKKRKYIIIIKKKCLTANYIEKLNALKSLIGEINEK